MASPTANIISLFAGCGGLDLGVHAALRRRGVHARTVCYVEREVSAVAVLAARMASGGLSPAPVWSDVSTFDGRPWRGVVDCVIGGFPCQDISVAGAGAGLDGERSGLFYELARIVREVRPAVVVLENVPALTFRGLDGVLAELARLGLDAEWSVLSAADVGASHLRRRIFVVAADPNRCRPDRWSPLADAGRRDAGRREHLRRRVAADAGGAVEDVADADDTGLEGRRRERGRADELAAGPSRAEVERHAFPPGPGDADAWRRWLGAGLPEPAIRRGAHGSAGRVDRLRMLGNGVVPQQAAEAVDQLLARHGL